MTARRLNRKSADWLLLKVFFYGCLLRVAFPDISHSRNTYNSEYILRNTLNSLFILKNRFVPCFQFRAFTKKPSIWYIGIVVDQQNGCLVDCTLYVNPAIVILYPSNSFSIICLKSQQFIIKRTRLVWWLLHARKHTRYISSCLACFRF